MLDALSQFREAIQAAGLNPPDVIEPDGKLWRFASNGKRGDDAGWYVLHADGIPAGSFGDWRSGLSESWRADIGRRLSPQEDAAYRARVEAMTREREAEDKRRRNDAAIKAVAIWKAAQSVASDHPYLTRKGVKPTATIREIHADLAAEILGYRPQAKGEPLVGRLLVAPVKVGDKLSTAELIDEAGRKSALYGGAKSGGYWAAQPLPEGAGDALILLMGEGVVTGAIREGSQRTPCHCGAIGGQLASGDEGHARTLSGGGAGDPGRSGEGNRRS
jgi:putative DNA primase/helicase